MLAALPPGQPGKGQLHEAFDIARVPVELDVLIDCDSVSETTSCFEALVVLLEAHGIRTWRSSSWASLAAAVNAQALDGADLILASVAEIPGRLGQAPDAGE